MTVDITKLIKIQQINEQIEHKRQPKNTANASYSENINNNNLIVPKYILIYLLPMEGVIYLEAHLSKCDKNDISALERLKHSH